MSAVAASTRDVERKAQEDAENARAAEASCIDESMPQAVENLNALVPLITSLAQSLVQFRDAIVGMSRPPATKPTPLPFVPTERSFAGTSSSSSSSSSSFSSSSPLSFLESSLLVVGSSVLGSEVLEPSVSSSSSSSSSSASSSSSSSSSASVSASASSAAADSTSASASAAAAVVGKVKGGPWALVDLTNKRRNYELRAWPDPTNSDKTYHNPIEDTQLGCLWLVYTYADMKRYELCAVQERDSSKEWSAVFNIDSVPFDAVVQFIREKTKSTKLYRQSGTDSLKLEVELASSGGSMAAAAMSRTSFSWVLPKTTRGIGAQFALDRMLREERQRDEKKQRALIERVVRRALSGTGARLANMNTSDSAAAAATAADGDGMPALEDEDD